MNEIRLASTTTLVYLVFIPIFIVGCSHTKKEQSEQKGTSKAQIAFSDSIHDFGTFASDAVIQKHSFTFQNTGTVPVAIVSVNPSCKCISVSYTREAVRPGESGSVEVTFDGLQALPGYFNKSVRVRINSSHIYTLQVSGTME